MSRKHENPIQKKRKRKPADEEEEKEKRARAWVFTINHYTEPQAEWIRDQLFTEAKCIYLIAGREVGGKKGVPHLQGYIYFASAKTADAVQKWLVPKSNMKGAWHRMANGTAEESREYCSKERNLLIEKGKKPSGAGQRGGKIKSTEENPKGQCAKLRAYNEDVEAGYKSIDLWKEHMEIMARLTKGCRSLYENYQYTKQKPKPTVFVCWGRTGTGKSHWVAESFGMDKRNVYWVTPGETKTWWGFYDQQPVVVFDDFEPRNMPQQQMKLCLDQYNYMVEGKGTQITMVSPIIVFTSNNDPAGWYRDHDLAKTEDVHWEAIQRRLGENIMEFKNRYNEDDEDYESGHALYNYVFPAPLGALVADTRSDSGEDMEQREPCRAPVSGTWNEDEDQEEQEEHRRGSGADGETDVDEEEEHGGKRRRLDDDDEDDDDVESPWDDDDFEEDEEDEMDKAFTDEKEEEEPGHIIQHPKGNFTERQLYEMLTQAGCV